jgi:D-glycero-D-manno-heptose 1,7-bisphosphate phosphatase
MQCVILVGGLGTRLGKLVRSRPKPILPVAGRPFVEYLIENAAHFGFDDFVLLAGYRAEVVEQLFAANHDLKRRLGLTIRVLSEPRPLGTAGCLRNAAQVLAPEFLLTNGDTFFDFNLADLRSSRIGVPWTVRLALRSVADTSRFGVVSLSGDGRVSEFKARSDGERRPGLINGGTYWVKRAILDVIPAGPSSLEQDVLPALAKRGLVRGKVYDGFFIDIGTPNDLAAAETLMADCLQRPAVLP